MEKFEIMQSIQNIADLIDDGFTFDSPKNIKEKLLDKYLNMVAGA